MNVIQGRIVKFKTENIATLPRDDIPESMTHDTVKDGHTQVWHKMKTKR